MIEDVMLILDILYIFGREQTVDIQQGEKLFSFIFI